MQRKIILGSLLFTLFFILYILFVSTPNAKKSLTLSPQQLAEHEHQAAICNKDALFRLIGHYIINQDQEKIAYWQEEEQKCIEKKAQSK